MKDITNYILTYKENKVFLIFSSIELNNIKLKKTDQFKFKNHDIIHENNFNVKIKNEFYELIKDAVINKELYICVADINNKIEYTTNNIIGGNDE